MAKRTVNRKELRAQNDAAEAREKSKGAKPAKAKKEKAAKEPKKEKPAKAEKKVAEKGGTAKKASRKKTAKEVRMKAFWGVFNQGMKKLVTFEYADKRAAEKKASDLGPNHFIQLVKEAITE
jgi:hypothetical protein